MYYSGRRYFFIPMIILGIIALSAVTMLLWNALAPSVLNLPVINFWQAAGLLVLTRLLFGGFKRYEGWHGHYRWHGFREKIAKMTPEERKEYFNKMCGGRYWEKSYIEEEKV